MGADGDGIGNLSDASPVYVAGSLPGERVRVRPSIRRGEGWAADIEAVVVPSADRVAPACPHFGACGGCSLQHWRAGPYAAWKSSLLAAALRRAGFDTGTAALIETTAGSRRRIDLAVRRQGGAVQLGLHRSHGSLIVDMHSCPVLHPDLFRLIAPLRDLLRGLSALKRAGAAVLNLLDTGPDLLLRTAERWYGADADCPAWGEPGGDDFQSPALIEAECMRRLLPPGRFLPWFERFLPRLAERQPATLFHPAVVTDRSDGKIAHLDGLNLSRAWCFRALASALPAGDARAGAMQDAAERHLEASLPHVAGDYMGEHWLATFALLALDA